MPTTYEFGDVALHVEEPPPSGLERTPLDQDYGPAHGLVVWNSALVICRLLELGLLPPLKGQVVEVGAGCGLPGMLVAGMQRNATAGDEGSRPLVPVLLTDNDPRVLQSLNRAIDTNGLAGRVEVSSLDWSAPQECEGLRARSGAFDWVIGADLLYLDTEPLYPELCATLAYLCRHGRGEQDHDGARGGSHRGTLSEPPSSSPCRVLLAYRCRDSWINLGDPEGYFLGFAEQAGFIVESSVELRPEVFAWETKEAKLARADDLRGLRVVILRLGDDANHRRAKLRGHHESAKL